MKLIYSLKICLTAAFLLWVAAACEQDETKVDLQKPLTYSDQYYKNLRDYKASKHEISFGWFADIAFTYSPGCRFTGLPDSLDICSLWGGIPDEKTNPIAYNEMKYVQRVKGTKMVFVTFPGISNRPEILALHKDQRVAALGDQFLKIIYDNNLDGIDMDNEIMGDPFDGQPLADLVAYLGQYIGPLGKDPSKLLIVDGYGILSGYKYLSYFVAQAYHSSGADDLQGRFNGLYLQGLPPEKFVVTETVAETPPGGELFTDAYGNRQSVFKNEPLRSLEGMARWNPTQGAKGGFGGFNIQYDYNNHPGYKYLRSGIQLQNPAVH